MSMRARVRACNLCAHTRTRARTLTHTPHERTRTLSTQQYNRQYLPSLCPQPSRRVAKSSFISVSTEARLWNARGGTPHRALCGSSWYEALCLMTTAKQPIGCPGDGSQGLNRWQSHSHPVARTTDLHPSPSFRVFSSHILEQRRVLFAA